MALIILMVFNAPIMAISLSQPNSSHSINETLGLLHSISTQGHTTFGDIDQTPRITSPFNIYSDSKRLYISSSSRPSALT